MSDAEGDTVAMSELPSRDIAILGGSDLEPAGPTVWNCPVCGRFQSERSPAHEECGEAMYEDMIQSERAWLDSESRAALGVSDA